MTVPCLAKNWRVRILAVLSNLRTVKVEILAANIFPAIFFTLQFFAKHGMGQATVDPMDIVLRPGGYERLQKKRSKPYRTKGPIRDLFLQSLKEMEEAGVGLNNPPKGV